MLSDIKIKTNIGLKWVEMTLFLINMRTNNMNLKATEWKGGGVMISGNKEKW